MKRFSYRLAIYQSIVFISTAIFAFLGTASFFLEEESPNLTPKEILISLGVALGVYVLFVIYSLLFCYKSGYELTDKDVRCQRGVFFKKKSIIEYTRIHAINKKQTLIQRLLGISALMIDSGSTNNAHNAEIVIYDKKDIIDSLYDKIKNPHNNEIVEEAIVEEEVENLYSFTAKRKFIYTFINSIFALIILAATVGLSVGIYYIARVVAWDGKMTLLDFVLVPLIPVGFTFIVLAIKNFIKAFISYYDFKIIKKNGRIEINYGLLSKISNSLEINRVKAVKITQGIFDRIFRFVTIRLEVVGYNESDQNGALIGILIPLCRVNEVNDYLEKILPSYVLIERQTTAKSYKALLLWPLCIASIIAVLCLIPVISFTIALDEPMIIIIGGGIIGSLYLIYIILAIISTVLQFYIQGITISEDKITLYSGGFIKNTTVVLKKDLIAIEDVTTYFQQKKGIYSYLIHFHTNAVTNVVNVKSQDKDLSELLINSLKY